MNIQRERRRLSGQLFEGGRYERLDLRGALGFQSGWSHCRFESVRFGQARFDQSTFADCSFVRCDFGQATLFSTFRNCTFDHCDFSQAQMLAAIISNSTFEKCRFQYANLTRACLSDVRLLQCDFHGAILDLAASERLDFTGSSFWGAVIPINCAFFYGNRFDRSQVHRLLALLLHGLGGWRDDLLPLVDAKDRQLVDRLVDAETKDENGNGVDGGGRRSVPMDPEVAAVGSSDSTSSPDLGIGRAGELREA